MNVDSLGEREASLGDLFAAAEAEPDDDRVAGGELAREGVESCGGLGEEGLVEEPDPVVERGVGVVFGCEGGPQPLGCLVLDAERLGCQYRGDPRERDLDGAGSGLLGARAPASPARRL